MNPPRWPARAFLVLSWKKVQSPVFQQAAGIYGPAHNGFFKSPDGSEDWIVYHANSNAADGCWTRGTTRVRRFDWNADGTPNFGTPLPLAADVRVPSGE